ncbi:hypothetical protein D3C81_2271100 [compost metagenome]
MIWKLRSDTLIPLAILVVYVILVVAPGTTFFFSLSEAIIVTLYTVPDVVLTFVQ